MNDLDSIERFVASYYVDLSPQLKLAADYVVAHPDQIASRSLRYVADQAGLSAPSLSRLARALGMDDYEALRQRCRDELSNRQLKFAHRANQLQRSGSGREHDLLGRQGEAAVSNVHHLLSRIDEASIETCAEKLLASRRVVLVGACSSLALIDYFAYMAALAFPHFSVAGRGGLPMSADLHELSRHDSVFVLSVNPYSRSVVDAATQAHRAGAHLISVSDSHSSPILRFSDQSFVLGSEGPHFMPSYVPVLVLLEALMAAAIRRGGKSASARITAVEKRYRSDGQYWQA